MHIPPVTSRQPLRGTGKGFTKPLRSLRASRFAHFSSNPQSLRDSP